MSAVLEARGSCHPHATPRICQAGPVCPESVPMSLAPPAFSTDESLMLAFGAGDLAAFTTLYDRHERPVYRYFLRNLHQDAAAAQDLLQDTWMAVVRNAASYAPSARFTTWLYTVAHHKLIDHVRSQQSHPTTSLDSPVANDPDDAAVLADYIADDPAFGPERQAMSRAQARAFLDHVEALPHLQRVAFLLHAEAGLSVDEIAALTGANAQTAKSRLRYAMAKLRNAMESWK